MRHPVWFRSGILVMSLLGVAAVAATGAAPPAHADTTLIGWTALADANPFDFVVDDAAGLSGIHPLSEADLPEDSSDFESGPFGHALASLFWPGAVAGNIGSLSGELPIPSQLAPLLGQLNDPVRAESFYPQGPASATYPSGSSSGVAEMSSHADSTGVWAKAGLSDVSSAGLFALQSVQGSTTATATSSAQSTAQASFSSVSMLGGLIQIGASTSSAEATSDGVTPTGTSSFHAGAVTVAGHSVSYGSDGLIVGPAQTTVLGSLTAAPTSAVQQMISMLQLKIVPLPASETRQAPAEKITSGGLQVSFSLPPTATLKLDCSAIPSQLEQLDVICTLPGLLQGASVTATLDRVTATAIATPPFPLGTPLPSSPGTTLGVVPATSGSAPVPSDSASTGESGIPSVTPVSGAASPAPSVSAPALSGLPAGSKTPSVSPVTPALSLVPVSLSRPVKAGLLIFLLLLAALAGGGLVRMTDVLDAPPRTPCPLEEPT